MSCSLTRLLDADTTLRKKIVEFVGRGDFGLASGHRPDLAGVPGAAQAGGTYERVWFREPVAADEVAFEPGVFLLTKAKAEVLKVRPHVCPRCGQAPCVCGERPRVCHRCGQDPCVCVVPAVTLVLRGQVPPEVWNRLGTKLLPKLRSGSDLKVGVEFSVTVEHDMARSLRSDLRQILGELGLADKVRVEVGGPTTACT